MDRNRADTVCEPTDPVDVSRMDFLPLSWDRPWLCLEGGRLPLPPEPERRDGKTQRTETILIRFTPITN